MKITHLIAAAALLLPSAFRVSAADSITLMTRLGANNSETNTLSIAAGDRALVTYAVGSAGIANKVKVDLTINGSPLSGTELFPPVTSGTSVPITVPLEVAGPATIKLTDLATGDGEQWHIATFQITRAAEPSVTPTNAAVIPEDANGTYQVILESSTDLISWNPALPGDYSGNTVQRFFRTRIVKKAQP